MSDEIVVDYEAMLVAARREAEMWRTAKDRLARDLYAAEGKLAALTEALNDLLMVADWYREETENVGRLAIAAMECDAARAVLAAPQEGDA